MGSDRGNCSSNRGSCRRNSSINDGDNSKSWVLVSVIADFWATIPNPTRPRVADSGTPYRYIG